MQVIKTCCEYHDEGSEKINAFIMTASARAGKSLYDGKPWIYCPWCGEQIRTKDGLSALLTITEVEIGYVSPVISNDISAFLYPMKPDEGHRQ